MALNGKYCSAKTIIDEVYRDNDYDTELPWQDSIEWIYDAMELIRVPMQYVGRKARLKVENFRTTLPCDYKQEVQIAGTFGGCNPFPMRSATNTFHPTILDCEWDNAWKDLAAESNTDTDSQLVPIGEDIAGNPVYEIFYQGDNFAMPSNHVVKTGGWGIDDATYKINENYIFTNFSDGYIYISYYAFPVDEKGYPLIPEDQKYKEAVKAYIRLKIDYKLWRKGKLTREIYNDSQQQWAWRVGQAQNGARIPTIAGMEGIKNQQLKLVWNKFHYNDFFKDLSR